MSTFREKSDQSLVSARLLVTNNLNSSCVNRSYYSSIQIMYHVLFEKLGYDKQEFDEKTRPVEGGSHVRASNIIGEKLESQDPQEYKWFQKKFKEFKKLRNRADYTPEVISQSDGRLSITTAETIVTLLSKIKK